MLYREEFFLTGRTGHKGKVTTPEQNYLGPWTSSHHWVSCCGKGLVAATPGSLQPWFWDALWRPGHSLSLFMLNQLRKHWRPKRQPLRLSGFIPEFASGLAPGTWWSSSNEGRACVDRNFWKCSPQDGSKLHRAQMDSLILQMHCVYKDLSVSETLKGSRCFLSAQKHWSLGSFEGPLISAVGCLFYAGQI